MAPWMRPFTEWRVYRAWSRAGRPVPAPPIVKQRLVRQCLQAHRLDAVVETGTFTGDMVDALMEHARRIVSIELDPRLYTAARRRFDGHPRVQLLHGDSANLLPSVIAGLNGRALFWLDGHYTVGVAGPERESPILNELRALLEAPPQGHVIMVDDIRLFVGRDGYPTVDAIRESDSRSAPTRAGGRRRRHPLLGGRHRMSVLVLSHTTGYQLRVLRRGRSRPRHRVDLRHRPLPSARRSVAGPRDPRPLSRAGVVDAGGPRVRRRRRNRRRHCGRRSPRRHRRAGRPKRSGSRGTRWPAPPPAPTSAGRERCWPKAGCRPRAFGFSRSPRR